MKTSSRRSSALPRLASTALALLLGASLAGCGAQDSDTASEPQPSTSPSTSTPTQTPTSSAPPETPASTSGESLPATGAAGITGATLLSGTDAGGSASTLAFALDTEQARTDFANQLKPDFGAAVLAHLQSQQPVAGTTPYGAIVAVGCDAPESVAIEAGEAGFEVTPTLPKESVQCFMARTFVVLFSAPDA